MSAAMPRPVPVLRVIENPKYVDVMTLLDECDRWLKRKGIDSPRYKKAHQALAERANREMAYQTRRGALKLVWSRRN